AARATSNVFAASVLPAGSTFVSVWPQDVTDAVALPGPATAPMTIGAHDTTRVPRITPGAVAQRANTLSSTTVSGDSSPGASATGGGIYFGNGGSLTLVNSTISGNVADSAGSPDFRGGGGIYFYGNVAAGGVTIRQSTISGNSGTSGGGIFFRNLGGTAPNIQ